MPTVFPEPVSLPNGPLSSQSLAALVAGYKAGEQHATSRSLLLAMLLLAILLVLRLARFRCQPIRAGAEVATAVPNDAQDRDLDRDLDLEAQDFTLGPEVGSFMATHGNPSHLICAGSAAGNFFFAGFGHKRCKLRVGNDVWRAGQSKQRSGWKIFAAPADFVVSAEAVMLGQFDGTTRKDPQWEPLLQEVQPGQHPAAGCCIAVWCRELQAFGARHCTARENGCCCILVQSLPDPEALGFWRAGGFKTASMVRPSAMNPCATDKLKQAEHISHAMIQWRRPARQSAPLCPWLRRSGSASWMQKRVECNGAVGMNSTAHEEDHSEEGSEDHSEEGSEDHSEEGSKDEEGFRGFVIVLLHFLAFRPWPNHGLKMFYWRREATNWHEGGVYGRRIADHTGSQGRRFNEVALQRGFLQAMECIAGFPTAMHPTIALAEGSLSP
eukprot:s2970_g9.t1